MASLTGFREPAVRKAQVLSSTGFQLLADSEIPCCCPVMNRSKGVEGTSSTVSLVVACFRLDVVAFYLRFDAVLLQFP